MKPSLTARPTPNPKGGKIGLRQFARAFLRGAGFGPKVQIGGSKEKALRKAPSSPLLSGRVNKEKGFGGVGDPETRGDHRGRSSTNKTGAPGAPPEHVVPQTTQRVS